jgi:hypothetical protein
MNINDSNISDEDLINNILDKGISEIRTSTNSVKLTTGSLKISESREGSLDRQQPKSSALKALLEDLKNEYKSKPLLTASDEVKVTACNFDNMKDEIKDLQNKLNGLEGKFNTTASREQSLTKKRSIDSDNAITEKRINRFIKPVNSAKSVKSIRSVKSDKTSSQSSLDRSLNKSINSLDSSSKVDWKEKYFKMKISYEQKKTELAKERILSSDLLKKNKLFGKKEISYDNLTKMYNDVKSRLKKMEKKFDDSELIRKEQSRLIKAMYGEIELLRNQTVKIKKKSSSKPKVRI